MKLKEYLKNRELSVRAFAAKVNCSPATISLIARGLRYASFDLALKIKSASSGNIDITETLHPKIASLLKDIQK